MRKSESAENWIKFVTKMMLFPLTFENVRSGRIDTLNDRVSCSVQLLVNCTFAWKIKLCTKMASVSPLRCWRTIFPLKSALSSARCALESFISVNGNLRIANWKKKRYAISSHIKFIKTEFNDFTWILKEIEMGSGTCLCLIPMLRIPYAAAKLSRK